MTDSGLPKRNIYRIISICFSILILLFLFIFCLITPRIVMIVGMLSVLFFTITLSIKECRNWINKFIRVKKESHVVLYGIIMCVFISLATYSSFSHIKAQTRHIELVKSEVNRLSEIGNSHFENKEYDLAKDNYLDALKKARELPDEYTKEFFTNINNGLKKLEVIWEKQLKEQLAKVEEERRRREEAKKRRREEIRKSSVSAADLYAEYEANAVAADEKYKGKIIQVTGTVYRTGQNVHDSPWGLLFLDPYVVLDAGGLIIDLDSGAAACVKCEFSKANKSRIDRLSKGDKITVKGKCRSRWIYVVILEECSFIEE